MNEENIPVTNEVSVITSVSQSSNTNDVIDLTEIFDNDACEVTSSCSVIVSNNSVDQQSGRKRKEISNSSEDNPSSKARSESADDSICILYENIQPPQDIVVVNEVIIDGRENDFINDDFYSVQIPPIIMGTRIETPIYNFRQTPPTYHDYLERSVRSSSQTVNYSYDDPPRAHQRDIPPPSLPSCKYATAHERPDPPISEVNSQLVAQNLSQPRTEVSLNLKTVSDNLSSHESELKKSKIEVKVPKIQCGICLDGPDEIAASDRNFTSTNCGHVFCNICIKTSMKNSPKCPKCRKKITAKQIHPLYL